MGFIIHSVYEIVRYLLIFLIQCYQFFVSPNLQSCCRFTPTCSSYAIQAFKKLNVISAICITVCRIMRCHPWSQGGYDPVKINPIKSNYHGN